MSIFYLNELNVINQYFRNLFDSLQNPYLTKWMVFLTDIGGPSSIALYCLALVMLMWLHKKYSHLIQFILTLSTTALVVVITKELIKLPRPTGGLISETGYSFASGHAMFAVVFFTLIAYSYKNHFKNRLIRIFFVGICICMIVTVSVSRVYLGVHYATDVIAGLFIGLIITAVSVLMYEKHQRIKTK